MFHPPIPKQLSFPFPDRRQVCANKVVLYVIIQLYLRKENPTDSVFFSSHMKKKKRRGKIRKEQRIKANENGHLKLVQRSARTIGFFIKMFIS